MTARFTATHIQSALEELGTERERIIAERDAFAKFRDRIAVMDVSQDRPDSGHDQRLSLQAATLSQSINQLQCVREAYRETVMSTSHYDEDYDESLSESLAAEFGPEVANALMTGTHLSISLRNRLLRESQQAYVERVHFLNGLSREIEDLHTADKTITMIGTDLDTLNVRSLETWATADLTESHKQLITAEDRCEELAATRQATLQNARFPGPTPSELDLDLNEYLYQSLGVTYPILADLADLADTLRAERFRVERALFSK